MAVAVAASGSWAVDQIVRFMPGKPKVEMRNDRKSDKNQMSRRHAKSRGPRSKGLNEAWRVRALAGGVHHHSMRASIRPPMCVK